MRTWWEVVGFPMEQTILLDLWQWSPTTNLLERVYWIPLSLLGYTFSYTDFVTGRWYRSRIAILQYPTYYSPSLYYGSP